MKFLLMIKYLICYAIDTLFSSWLLHTRKDSYFLTEEKFQHIKKCAELAYHNEELDYHDCDSMNDLLDQLGERLGKVYILVGETWYFILIREMTHIVAEDFASSTGKCPEIIRVYKTLFELFRGKYVFMKSRESTSYPIIKALERKGTYSIKRDETIDWNGEKYHNLLIKSYRTPHKKKKTRK